MIQVTGIPITMTAIIIAIIAVLEEDSETSLITGYSMGVITGSTGSTGGVSGSTGGVTGVSTLRTIGGFTINVLVTPRTGAPTSKVLEVTAYSIFYT
jgi:hypothetical protein